MRKFVFSAVALLALVAFACSAGGLDGMLNEYEGAIGKLADIKTKLEANPTDFGMLGEVLSLSGQLATLAAKLEAANKDMSNGQRARYDSLTQRLKDMGGF
jgi:hypothetical protein